MNLQILDKQLKEIIPFQLKINDIIGCKRCGWCCKSCNINIDFNDIENIIKYLRIDFDNFYNSYMEQNAVNNYLKRPCPFLKQDNKCEIYSVRPKVCREFPFQEYRITCEPCRMGGELKQFISQVNAATRKKMHRNKHDTNNLDKRNEHLQKERIEFNEAINKFMKTGMPHGEEKQVLTILLPLDPSYIIELYRHIQRSKVKK